MSKTPKQRRKTANATLLEPRNWGSNTDRLLALDDFMSELKKSKPERQKCCSSPRHAKNKFAEWGRFYIEGAPPTPNLPPVPPKGIEPIPKKTKFRVHPNGERNRLKRDKRVILILPAEPGEDPEAPKKFLLWRCSYTPYEDKKNRAGR